MLSVGSGNMQCCLWEVGSDLSRTLPLTGSDEELAEDLLKPGHLNGLLDEALGGEVLCLSLPEVSAVVEQLLETIRVYRDSCPPHKLQVPLRRKTVKQPSL